MVTMIPFMAYRARYCKIQNKKTHGNIQKKDVVVNMIGLLQIISSSVKCFPIISKETLADE